MAGSQELSVVRVGSTLAHSILADLPSSSIRGHDGANLGRIPRVPANIRDVKCDPYDPRIVSVGPYHRGKERLQDMEQHKKRYLRRLLERGVVPADTMNHTDGTNDVQAIDALISAVKAQQDQAKAWYSDTIDIDNDEFVKMLVLDGCFVIELLIKFRVRSERSDDAIFAVANLLPLIRRDLLLLENQIPFFVLEGLYGLVVKPTSLSPFPTLKEISYAYLMIQLCTDQASLADLTPYHLLHLYELILLPKQMQSENFDQNSPETIPSATKLKEAGIKIARRNTHNFLDILFKDGILYIPCLQIKDITKPIFRNLVAFEQCCADAKNHFTAYVRFMDLIVNTPKDVELLQERGVIENKLGSEEEVAEFLNQMFTEIILDHQNHYLVPVFRGIDNYCRTMRYKLWSKHWRKFMQDCI